MGDWFVIRDEKVMWRVKRCTFAYWLWLPIWYPMRRSLIANIRELLRRWDKEMFFAYIHSRKFDKKK